MSQRIIIDLGKGVALSAPIKMRMTLEEWVRMTEYVNSLLPDKCKINGVEVHQIKKH